MKHGIVASLLLVLAGFTPLQAHTDEKISEERTPPRQDRIQVGGSVVEFLLCVGEAHASGATWDEARELCQSGAAGTLRTNAAPSGVQPQKERIQVGGWVIEYLLCAGEAHASGATWDEARELCQSGAARKWPTGSAHPEVPPEEPVQAGGIWVEWLICVGEAHTSGATREEARELCLSTLEDSPAPPAPRRATRSSR